MHYHAEIVMPPTKDISKAVERLMKNFSEDNEDGYPGFWDWYVIGGRYSGAKIEAAIGNERLKGFYQKLTDKKITVSGVQAGKQSLHPSDQIAVVDGMWSEEFPEFAGPCPLFDHYNDKYGKDKEILPVDVCTVEKMPHGLTCYTLMIAGPEKDSSPREMLHQRIWNGCTFQETTFNGNVKEVLQSDLKNLEGYKKEYAEKAAVKGDWLVVTVDYHS
jgi:hypothetical protein